MRHLAVKISNQFLSKAHIKRDFYSLLKNNNFGVTPFLLERGKIWRNYNSQCTSGLM